MLCSAREGLTCTVMKHVVNEEVPVLVVFQDYYKSGRMLVRMAEAIGRIVLAGREMTRLAG